MANDMKVHLFRVRTMDGAEPLVDLLTRIKADALDARLRRIGYHEMRMESIVAPSEDGNDSLYWLLDFTKLRFEHGPGKISRGAPIEGFELEDDEGFGEVRISVNVPTHSGLSCPLAHEMVLRG